MTAEKDPDAANNTASGGHNKDNKVTNHASWRLPNAQYTVLPMTHQQQAQQPPQPLFQPMAKPIDASTNELIRMLQTPQRIVDKDTDIGPNGNNNKDLNQVRWSISFVLRWIDYNNIYFVIPLLDDHATAITATASSSSPSSSATTTSSGYAASRYAGWIQNSTANDTEQFATDVATTPSGISVISATTAIQQQQTTG